MIERHWYQLDKGSDDVAKRLIETAKRVARQLNREQTLRTQLGMLFNRIYKGTSPGEMTYSRTSLEEGSALIINTLFSVYKTLLARVCINRPRPQFLSDGGSWSLRRRAKRLDKFVLGEFHRNNVYALTEQAFSDALWADIGIVKVHGRQRVLIERVFPGEILVDEQGALTSPPRTLYHVKDIPAEVLKADYPEHEQRINDAVARRGLIGYGGERSSLVATDLITVYEAYHLPSKVGADDGRLVIAIETGSLYDDQWDDDRFPFAFAYWTQLPIGFYGQSLVEQQAPIQRNTNELFARFEESFGINAMRVFAEEGTIDREHMTNRPGDIVFVKKTAARWPTVQAAGSVPSDSYQHAWNLVRAQKESAGLSEYSTSASKPSGDMSGVALRALQDVETQLHGLAVRAYERFVMDVAELTVRQARRIHEETGEYQVSYVGRRFVQSIKWDDVDLDHYVLQLWPANMLPATPAGKLATVQDMLALQLINEQEARVLLDSPDIDGISMEGTEVEFIDFIAEKLLDGESWPPQEYLSNLSMAVRRIGWHIMEAHMDGATAEDVQPLIDWLGQAAQEHLKRQARTQAIMSEAQAAMAPPPAAGPAMAQGMPAGIGEVA